ncbi:MAG TPA: disulfide bond formation protein B [Gammaproteobacteria bacterium]|nr:disulfide bond formation protein B [Gammaproteobacteria bacterium]
MSTRFIYFLGFVIAGLILGISIYLQCFAGFIPCPLCTLQRFAFAAFGIFCLFGLLLSSKLLARMLINTLMLISAIFGLFFSGRQIWLQHFPPAHNSECGVSLEYMLQALPLQEVIQKVFVGSAECTERGWSFLFLNMAEWSLLWFILFFVMSVYLLLKRTF